MPRAKKVVNEKNAFLHARQLREEIFDVCLNGYCIFTIEVFFQNGRHQSNFEKKKSQIWNLFHFSYVFSENHCVTLVLEKWTLSSEKPDFGVKKVQKEAGEEKSFWG